MFSLKTCLASLLVAAITLTDTANAEVQPGVKERLNVARHKLASRHQKFERSLMSPYDSHSDFLQTRDAKHAATIRCTPRGNMCSKYVKAPQNAEAVCEAGRCTLRCKDGYAPQGTSCVPDAEKCGNTSCPDVVGGFNTCKIVNKKPVCSPGCYPGTTLFNSGKSLQCFNVQNDENNCAAPNRRCPVSYNGVGKPKCNNGSCTLVCPAGKRLRQVKSNAKPLACH